MTSACRTMPAVVPTPSSSNSEADMAPSGSNTPPCIRTSITATAMTTRLLTTGAQAGTPNFSLVFRMAPNNAAMP